MYVCQYPIEILPVTKQMVIETLFPKRSLPSQVLVDQARRVLTESGNCIGQRFDLSQPYDHMVVIHHDDETEDAPPSIIACPKQTVDHDFRTGRNGQDICARSQQALGDEIGMVGQRGSPSAEGRTMWFL